MDEKTEKTIAEQITLLQLFVIFMQMSLCGFGGVSPWLYRFVVEKQKWIDVEEYTELLSMGQVIPGANVTNFAAMFGYRVRGIQGTMAALGGMLIFPFLIVLTLGIIYERYGQIENVRGTLRGILAVSAGMIILTGIKLAKEQMKKTSGWGLLFLTTMTVGGVSIFNFPLPVVVASVFIVGILLKKKIEK